MVVWAVVALAATCLFLGAQASETNHVYERNEEVTLWLNKIGPFHNPQETYKFYTLPFCKPEGEFHEQTKYAGIGEVLEGNSLVHSAMHMKFPIDVPKTQLCSQTLSDGGIPYNKG